MGWTHWAELTEVYARPWDQASEPHGCAVHDRSSFSSRMTVSYGCTMRWMRRRGDRIIIIDGRYAGHTGAVESNVYQRTADYPDEQSNGHHIMLDSGNLVTVRWDQVETIVVSDPSWPLGC